MKFLTEFSIKNTLLINLVTAFIIVFGIVSIFNMQREVYPRFSFDLVMITTPYPGSSPEEIEKLITIPIEKEIKQVDELDEIHSVSTEGMSLITVKIDEDAKNKEKIVNDIQRAVDRTDDLPSDLIDKPQVAEVKTQDIPIIEVSLSGNLPEDELRRYALALEKKILDMNSVARVDRRGLRDKEIWVEARPEALAANHLSLEEIARALAAQNKATPGGKYYLNGKEFLLRTSGEIKTDADVKDTVIRASTLGNFVKIGDIAEVTANFEEETTINRTDGTRSISLTVVKRSVSDTILLVSDLKTLVADFQKDMPKELHIGYVNDLSYYIKRRQEVLISNGIIGLGFVIITLFVFLSSRTAIGACFGIPTALCLTFAVMHVAGITINLISMFGLIMVIGMLVDEDIVISENIHRHLQGRLGSRAATIQGTNEVATAIVVTVLTTIAAFVPLYYMGGIMGKFCRDIPLVVGITLCASLFEALTVLPSHIYELNKNVDEKKEQKRTWSDRVFDRLNNSYRRFLKHGLRYRYVYSVGIFVLFGLSLWFAKANMRFILFPGRGIEAFYVQVEGPQGDSLETTSEKILAIEKIVAALPKNELDNYTTTVGIIQQDPNDPHTKRASHAAQIKVFLTPESDRDRDTQVIIDDIREKTKDVKGFDSIHVSMQRSGPPVGKPIQVRVRGDDYPTLKKIADKFSVKLKPLAGVSDVDDDYDIDKDEYHIEIDTIKAAQTGLTVAQIAATIRTAFAGAVATTIKTSEEEIDVVVKFPVGERHDPKSIGNLVIANDKGNLIDINHFAVFEPKKSITAIKHYDGARTVNITANIDDTKVSPLEVKNILLPLIDEAEAKNPNYTVHFGGEVEETDKSLSNLKTAMILACGLILIMLIAMFKSLIKPLVIMLSIPLSLIGVIWAFYLHSEPFSFMALLGVIGITGIVVDSGTIQIDFINALKREGLDNNESIIEGAIVRLKPILLTSFTNFVGIIPSAYGIGGNDPFINPMALALNYGILFGAVVTVLFLPLFLAIVDDAHGFYIWMKMKVVGRGESTEN